MFTNIKRQLGERLREFFLHNLKNVCIGTLTLFKLKFLSRLQAVSNIYFNFDFKHVRKIIKMKEEFTFLRVSVVCS